MDPMSWKKIGVMAENHIGWLAEMGWVVCFLTRVGLMADNHRGWFAVSKE